MKDLKSTLSMLFLKGVGPIEKHNQDGLVESCVCVVIALNQTISSKKLDRDKFLQL